MNKLTLIIMVLSLIPLASALDYSQGAELDLKAQCVNNGALCSSGVCNITILNPVGSYLVFNEPMSNNNSFFNYTLTNTNELGTYTKIINCCDLNDCNTLEETFNITLAGDTALDKTDLLIALGMIAAILIIISLFIAEKELIILKLSLAFTVLFIGLVVIPAVLLSNTIAVTLYKFTSVLMWLIMGGVMLFVFWKLFILVKDWLVNK